MANTYIPVDMDIGSNRTVLVNIRSDVAKHFDIKASTNTADQVVTRTRKAHKRNNFSGADDTTSEAQTNVEKATWQSVKRVAAVGRGKAVKIPTGLTSGPKNTPRFTTIRFPGNANIASISNFLHEKCNKNKPSYFMMASGTRYPVVKVAGDVNPGEADTTTGTDTGAETNSGINL